MQWVWIVTAAGVILLLVWAWRAQQRKFADEIFEGVTPGLAPAPGQVDQRGPVKGGEYAGEIAVAFNPPRGIRPGLAGTVVDGKPETRDVMATIVDLAARGHLSVTIVEEPSASNGKDWELRVAGQRPIDRVEPAERDLLQTLFMDGPTVRLSHLPAERNPSFTDARYALANDSYEGGYFRHVTGMQPVRIVWIVAGALLLIGFATGTGAILAGAAVAALGGAMIGARTTQRPVRTAEGSAVRIQTLGFKRYLETAETEQFSYEEAAGIFSKYLPWAIVLGVAAHWVKVFGDLAAQARADGYSDDFDLLWLGVMGWGMHDAMFSLAMFSAMDGMDGMGAIGDGGGLGDAFGDPGAMFDNSTIDGMGADAGGAFGDFGADSSVADAGGWGGDFGGGGGDWGGGGGDFGGFGGE